jgi:hypothetical protein
MATSVVDLDEGEQPTVMITIGESTMAFNARGEIIETTEYDMDSMPVWKNGSICSSNGSGGSDGFDMLWVALNSAETNAKMIGLKPRRLPK